MSAMDWKVNLGVAVLGMLLVISVLAVLGFLGLPLLAQRATRQHPTQVLCYFVAVGLGCILVEVSFIHRFFLFLGHPTFPLTVALILMMVSSGASNFAPRSWLS